VLHFKSEAGSLSGAMKTPRILSTPVAAMLAVAFFAGPLFAQTPTVKGTFLGDGKDGKIQYLVVKTREPFSDKAAIKLVFTEKNPASSKDPDFDAGFNKLGSALLISVFKDGRIFGCEVAHTAHEKSPFSAIGEIKMEDFKVTDTTVSGRLTTGGELDAFGQKWNVDITFSGLLPKGAFAEAAPTPKPKDEEAEEEKTKPTGPKLPVGKLPLPSSALDVEYKQTVEHIGFSSVSSVNAVATEFSTKLNQQGWKKRPGELIGKTNAILKRELNGAELTIMFQPAGGGCTVKVFAEGLDWTDTPASAAAKPVKAAPVDDIEAEANRIIKDAMKQIPSGF